MSERTPPTNRDVLYGLAPLTEEGLDASDDELLPVIMSNIIMWKRWSHVTPDVDEDTAVSMWLEKNPEWATWLKSRNLSPDDAAAYLEEWRTLKQRKREVDEKYGDKRLVRVGTGVVELIKPLPRGVDFANGTVTFEDLPKAPTPLDNAVAPQTEADTSRLKTGQHGMDQDAGPASKPRTKNRMTRQQANERAMEIAKNEPEFAKKPNVRKWAERIGCSEGLVCKLPFYQACSKEAGTSRKGQPSKPKAVSLTDKVEASHGEGERDEVLNRLISDQEADHEPSPLDETLRKPPREPKQL